MLLKCPRALKRPARVLEELELECSVVTVVDVGLVVAAMMLFRCSYALP